MILGKEEISLAGSKKKLFDNIKQMCFFREIYQCFLPILMVLLVGCSTLNVSNNSVKEELGSTIGYGFGRLLVSSLLGLYN
jgi:hypothetical protein